MLTDTKIRKIKPSDKAIRLRDVNGLYMDVRPTGAKVWRCRFKIEGKEGTFTIGNYPDVSLSEARQERDRIKQLAKKGVNPNEHREQEKMLKTLAASNTFESVALELFERNRKKWTHYYCKQWKTSMDRDILPAFGSKPVSEISAHEVLRLLQSVEERGAPTVAINIRQWCSQVFRHAIVTLRADIDPAAMLGGAVVRPKTKHNPGLDAATLERLVNDFEKARGYRTTQIALWLILLLFPRTAELRQATWDEIDMDAGIWYLQPERMKARKRHIVPLSSQAIDLLLELHTLTGNQKWLFPNYRRPTECMSATTILRLLGLLGWKGEMTGHGFRTTASTLLHEMGYRSDLIERQLAHSDRNKVRAAYNHAEYLDERREMLQDWANWIWHLRGLFCLLRDPFSDRSLRPTGTRTD